MEQLKVVSPVGVNPIRRSHSAPGLDTLAGKTIGEVWNGDFKGDLTFPMIRDMLKQRFMGLKIVPYTEFPHQHGSDDPRLQRERALHVAQLAREKGCDALISGNGA